MNEIVLTVKATFTTPELKNEFLLWLREGHVEKVLTGGATSYEIVELDAPTQGYAVHYRFPSRVDFDVYCQKVREELLADRNKRFPEASGAKFDSSLTETPRG